MKGIFANRRERMLQLKTKREQLGNASLIKQGMPCPSCSVENDNVELNNNLMVCQHCGHHLPISAYHRLSLLLDSGSFSEIEPKMQSADPLSFPKYKEKIDSLQSSTGLKDGIVAASGRISGYPAVVAVLDSRFLMGSMGAVVGEKVSCAVEYATKHQLPLIIFSASGGARMQEGIISLMQMAKTCAAVERFANAGGLFISYLTHPTTGGVTASFASMGDITLAEPNALIGFAGPRVIEQTIGQKLPEGFQRSEFLQQHGYVDKIISRDKMKSTLTQLLRLHSTRAHGSRRSR